MGKRTANKKGRSRKSPARSTKTNARRLKKLRLRKLQRAGEKRRAAALDQFRRVINE